MEDSGLVGDIGGSVNSGKTGTSTMTPNPAGETALHELARGPLSDSVKGLERESLQMPTGQDFHFYSNFQEFKRPVASIQSRVVTLLSQLGSLKEIIPHHSPFPADVDEGYDWLVGVQDAFLERVDASLDKSYQERKELRHKGPEWNAYETTSKQKLSYKAARHSVASEGSTKTGDVKVARSKDKSTMRSPIPFHIPTIPRPQDKFDDAVDNSNTLFRHQARIQKDAGAITSQETGQASGQTSTVVSTSSVLEEHARKLGHRDPVDNVHPLEEELTKMAYVEGLSDTVEIRKYESLDDTPLTLVTTLKALKEMAVKLRAAGEIAIDLENHHYRSYQGFVCLMQVSTRDEDFIVDTLDLRSQIGPCLGDIFEDPTIKKVMHGADRDIVWLQRDFGIYVCNLFDTGQAARVLQLQGFGLAFLLEHFCGVHADKRYQLADWRIRPLPAEMTKYAREDTHYLLYVHDMLKQLLLDARANGKGNEDDPFLQVYKRSRDICLQLYAKEVFTETSFQQIYGLHEKKFRPEQLAVLASLYSWRDAIARKEDESTGYVLPNHLLVQLGCEMPEDVRQLQSFVKGSHSFAARHAGAVIEIIRQAKDKALRDVQESQLELEEGELRPDFLKEEVFSEEMNSEVSKMDHALQIKETLLEVASNSAQDQEGRMETSFSSTTLLTCNLVMPIEASTMVRMAESDTLASEITGSDKAGYSLTGTESGKEQSKLTSEGLTGPVVVGRKISSSLFRRKPAKIPSVPLPSSNVPMPKELGRISEAQGSPTALLVSPTSLTGTSQHGMDQGMSDAFAVEQGITKSLNGGEGPGQDRERTVSYKSLTAKTAVMSIEIQTAGTTSSAVVEAVDGDYAMPSHGPEILPLSVTLREGSTSENQVNATSVDNSNSKTAAVVVTEKVSENAPIIQAKMKPSKLGGLLGGRRRVQQTGGCESAKDVEQVRIKTQDIESSMVLPFGPPVEVLPASVQRAGGEVKVFTTPEDILDDENRNLHKKTGRSFDEETPERPASSTVTQLPDVLMLETEADEASPRIGSDGAVLAKDLEEPRKHRTWWPPSADKSEEVPHRGSNSRRPGSLDTSRDQRLDNPVGDRNPDVPISLSEMRRNSRGKKFRRHSEISFHNVNQEASVRDLGSRESGSRDKKRRKEQSLSTNADTQVTRVVTTENNGEFSSFNYREARDVLGLDNLYNEEGEDRQGKGRGRGRGRGSKKDSNRVGIPLSKTAFDPLRRAREEPRPDGIKAGPRRQVFPQTGNRTSVFKQ